MMSDRANSGSEQLGMLDVDSPAQPVILKPTTSQERPVAESDPQLSSESAIPQIRRAAAALVSRLKPLASLRAKGGAAHRELEKAIEALGDPATFANAFRETAEQAIGEARRARAGRATAFNKALAQFARTRSDREIRETAVGWRVGAIELERRSEDASLRARYNREPMTQWTPVNDAADVEELVRIAEKAMSDQQIADQDLGSVFTEAWDGVVHSGSAHPAERVAIRELLSEVRVVLFRRAIKGKKRSSARAAADMPAWALLYNADRYRSQIAAMAPEHRIRFETGGQKETARIGVVLNGLDPNRQYESYCYVRPAGRN